MMKLSYNVLTKFVHCDIRLPVKLSKLVIDHNSVLSVSKYKVGRYVFQYRGQGNTTETSTTDKSDEVIEFTTFAKGEKDEDRKNKTDTVMKEKDVNETIENDEKIVRKYTKNIEKIDCQSVETAAKDEKVSGKSRKRADKKPAKPEFDDQPTENNAREENDYGKSRKDADKYPAMADKVYENGSAESLTMREIEKLLTEYKMTFHDGHTCFMVNCLKMRINKKPAESKAVFINKTTGYFTCLNCKKHGSWSALKENFDAISKASSKKNFVCFSDIQNLQSVHDMIIDSEHVQESLEKSVLLKDYSGKTYTEIQNQFGFENILKSIMMKHDIAFDTEKNSMLIPYRNPDEELTACKQITLLLDEDNDVTEIKHSFTTKREPISMFGWTKGDKQKTSLVLTLSEKDVLAVQQATADYCVLSIPKETHLPQEALPYLERFKTVILWFGSDMKSWLVTKQFAMKLGEDRCVVFRPSDECPTPYEALKQKKSLDLMLTKAKPLKNDSITSFKELRKDVLSELSHHEQVAGVKWKRFTQLNKLLKGFRPGELTVMTGRTGSGKTTFMSEYSLDLCMQGVNTLWGSFEVNNVRLAKTMLTQFCLKNLTLNLNEFDSTANEFQQLPMYFMTFFGQENIKNVIETMAHAVYIHDIQHVIVDNLQFMMGDDMFTQDKFNRQDKIYSAFRKFASIHNCHVSLVIHPRKENEDTVLTTSSIFGSAKATQEADNVILLQDKRIQSYKGKKYIQVTKNRFDGELGMMNLKFDTESLTFSNVNKKPDKIQSKGKVSTEDIDMIEDD